MTFILSLKLPEGIILIADSRIEYTTNGGRKIYRDIGQKVYKLSNHICVSFAGDVRSASVLIDSLMSAFKKEPKLKQIEYFDKKAEGILNFTYKRFCESQKVKYHKTKNPLVNILIAGISKHDIDLYDKALEKDDENNLPQVNTYLCTFNFYGKTNYCKKSIFNVNEIASIGSGSKHITQRNLFDLIKSSNFEGLELLADGPLKGFVKVKGMIFEAFFRSIIGKSDLKNIGGVIQRISINKDGVNLSGKFGLSGSKSLIFKEGYNGNEWAKVKDNRELLKLLNCEGIIKINKDEWNDLLL